MLAIIAAITSALGRYHHFFDAEASGFVQLYGNQISKALSWTIEDPLTFPLLEEIEQTVGLFYAIAQSSPAAGHPQKGESLAVSKVLKVFRTHALKLLQQLNYALTHPNHLGSLFEAVTVEERGLLEREPQTAPTRLIDAAARPLLTRIVYRLFKLTSSILEALVSISHAETVLLGDQEDWPIDEAHVVPVSLKLNLFYLCLLTHLSV
jgi:nuclear pore complex protein Nup188